MVTPDRYRVRGFTLLEVLLALAVIVALAGLAWPVLDGAFANQRLRNGADRLRSAWGQARVRAMESGENQVFHYQSGSGQFSIHALCSVESQTDASPTAGASGGLTGTLPEGVTFLASQTRYDTRTALAGGSDPSGRGDALPIVFFPDGTTSTAEIALGGRGNRCLKVSLRGLTAVALVSNIMTQEELAR